MSQRDPRLVRAVEAIAAVLVAPLLVLYRAGAVSFSTGSLAISLIPGQGGRMLRRAWYRRTLAACGRRLVVDFGAAMRDPRSRIGDDCAIGHFNWFGWVDIGDGFMSGNRVTVMSGMRQHRYDRTDVPMYQQGGTHSCVTIGEDVWVGAHVVIGADVAPHSILGSGAVVTRTFAPYDILGGVPARPIGNRLAADPG